MDKKDISDFKQKLLTLKQELQEQEAMSKSQKETVELDQTRMGRLSRMDAMQLQQMALEDSRRREQQLIKIEGALRRMEADEYGECYICGEDIDPRRLNIDPTHTRCIECVDK